MGGIRSSRLGFFPPPEFTIYKPFILIPLFKDKVFLHQKYVVERLSCEQIAAQIFSSRTTVLKWLKAFQIPLRPVGFNKRRWNLSYGKKFVNGTECSHLTELANIQKMYELRRQGHSFWKIADILNTMKVPTKTRRGRWQARSVQRIMESQVI